MGSIPSTRTKALTVRALLNQSRFEQ